MDIDHRLELMRLLSALCDGELTDLEHERLDEFLAGDAEARRVYLQYIDLHVRLMVHPGLAGSTVPATLDEGRLVASSDHTASVELPAGRTRHNLRRLVPYAVMATATLAAAIVLQVMVWRPAEVSSVAKGTRIPASEFPSIATVTQSADAEWEEESEPLVANGRVATGDVRLKQGVARIHFDSGGDLVVEGPATVRVESVTAAALLLGKAVFRIDSASAARFILTTPTATLVESQTEYGLEVAREREEVHVFAGKVQRRAKAAPSTAEPQQLTAGEARRFTPLGDAFGEPTMLDRARFIRDLPRASVLAYEGFDYGDANAIRNHAALGGSGWIGSWESGFVIPYGFGWSKRRSSTLNVEESLLRLDVRAASVGGSYDFTGLARCYRKLAAPLRLDADGTYYLSFLICRDGPPLATDRTNSVSVALREVADFDRQRRRGQFESGRRLELGIDRRNELFAELEKNSDRTNISLAYNETYLLIAKIVASAEGPDRVFLRVYGPDETVDREEPGSWPVDCPPVSSNLVFDCLELHINSWRRQSLDEIRLGTTWAAVTAPWIAAP